MVIMGIDDSTTMRKIIGMAVKEDHTFIEAENGKDALDKLSGSPKVDAFLVDVNMPVMGGIDFVKEIRKSSAYSTTPVIIITTETNMELKDLALAAGANAWLIKPFEKAHLIEALGKLF